MERILHLVTNMNLGGIETTLISYNKEIIKHNYLFDYLILSKEKGFFHDEIVNYRGKIFYFGKLNIYNFALKSIALFNFFKKSSYSVVHFHLDSNAFIPLISAYLAGIRVRITHSHTSMSKNNRLLRGIFNRIIPYLSTDLYACNHLSGSYMFRRKHYSILVNAIDLKKFEFSESKRLRIRDDLGLRCEFTLGFVGSLVDEKNFIFLIDLITELKKFIPNVLLLVLGDGPLILKLKNESSLRNLEINIRFLGRKTNPNDYYHAMDIFVLPSKFEGSPVVIWEALANGLKAILNTTIKLDFSSENVVSISAERLMDWVSYILDYFRNPIRNIDQDLLKHVDIENNVLELIKLYESKTQR